MRNREVEIAVDHIIDVVEIGAAGLLQHNREAALAMKGTANALRKRRSALIDQIIEKIGD